MLRYLESSSLIKFNHGNKDTGMIFMKTPLNRACQNHYLDSRCILTVMITEVMSRAICCKKVFRIIRYGSKRIFR